MRSLSLVPPAGLLLLLGVGLVTGQSLRGVILKTQIMRHNLTEMIKIGKIKQDILERLGKRAPPVKQTNPANNNLVYLLLREEEKEANTPEASQILSFSEAPDKYENEKIIQFRFANDVEGKRLVIESANLWLRVKQKRKRRQKKVMSRGQERAISKQQRRRQKRGSKLGLSVYSVSPEGLPDQNLATMKVRVRRNKWFKLSLNSTHFQELVDSSNGTVLLYVHCKGCKRNARLVLVNSGRRKKRQLKKSSLKKRKNLKLKKDRPFILLHTFLESREKVNARQVNIRVKRSRSRNDSTASSRSGDSECRDGSTRCCERQLYIDFRAIGWGDWIISPRGFSTADCVGSCQQTAGIIPSNSTECAPTRKRGLRLVYQESRGVYISSTIPDFIVSQCGCAT